MYGTLNVRLFPNKRKNVDLKNIEIWISHGLNKNPSSNPNSNQNSSNLKENFKTNIQTNSKENFMSRIKTNSSINKNLKSNEEQNENSNSNTEEESSFNINTKSNYGDNSKKKKCEANFNQEVNEEFIFEKLLIFLQGDSETMQHFYSIVISAKN